MAKGYYRVVIHPSHENSGNGYIRCRGAIQSVDLVSTDRTTVIQQGLQNTHTVVINNTKIATGCYAMDSNGTPVADKFSAISYLSTTSSPQTLSPGTTVSLAQDVTSTTSFTYWWTTDAPNPDQKPAFPMGSEQWLNHYSTGIGDAASNKCEITVDGGATAQALIYIIDAEYETEQYIYAAGPTEIDIPDITTTTTTTTTKAPDPTKPTYTRKIRCWESNQKGEESYEGELTIKDSEGNNVSYSKVTDAKAQGVYTFSTQSTSVTVSFKGSKSSTPQTATINFS